MIMIYDIRNISIYFKEIHSRYYIDTNGVVYTSIAPNTTRIMVDGKRININKFKKENIQKLNNTNNLLTSIPDTNNKYYLMNNGLILHRLSTRIDDIGEVDVNLMRVDGSGNPGGNRYKLHRLLAGCFLGDITNKEVHHKDGNRTNNKLSNLEILTFEEHRGKGNFTKNHTL